MPATNQRPERCTVRLANVMKDRFKVLKPEWGVRRTQAHSRAKRHTLPSKCEHRHGSPMLPTVCYGPPVVLLTAQVQGRSACLQETAESGRNSQQEQQQAKQVSGQKAKGADNHNKQDRAEEPHREVRETQ